MTLTLDASQVEQLLPHIDTLAEMRRLFYALGTGKATQSPQTLTLFPDNRGDFITYLGAIAEADVFGAKLSPYLVTGTAPIITAWTCLMSMRTGTPLMLCDSGLLTTERTAGTTAFAVDLLAPRDARTLAIIGSGAVAQAHLRQVSTLRNWVSVRLYSPSLAQNAEKKEQWRALWPDIVITDSAESAARQADVVMLCTSSGTPVIELSAIGQNTLVTSISTNVSQAHEVPPDFLNAAQVYCDYRTTTPLTAGEMVLAARSCGWHVDSIVGDLAELASGRGALPSPERPAFFRSIGLGLEDVAMANAVYRAATA